ESGGCSGSCPGKRKLDGRAAHGEPPEKNPKLNRSDAEKTAENNQDYRIEASIGGQQQEGSADLPDIHGDVDKGDVTHLLPSLENTFAYRRERVRNKSECKQQDDKSRRAGIVHQSDESPHGGDRRQRRDRHDHAAVSEVARGLCSVLRNFSDKESFQAADGKHLKGIEQRERQCELAELLSAQV